MYCNYSKDKFGNEITYIKPWWLEKSNINDWESRRLIEGDFNLKDGVWYECCYNYQNEKSSIWNSSDWFLHQLRCAETTYFQLLKQGLKPEEARGVLPLATKCDMMMTGFVSDWEHFFSLRALGTTGKPHPQAKELAGPLMQEFINKNILYNELSIYKKK
jgi:thymidylate synthase (FAD)